MPVYPGALASQQSPLPFDLAVSFVTPHSRHLLAAQLTLTTRLFEFAVAVAGSVYFLLSAFQHLPRCHKADRTVQPDGVVVLYMLPALEHRGFQAQLIAQLGNPIPVQQMPSQNGDLFFSAVMLSFFFHASSVILTAERSLHFRLRRNTPTNPRRVPRSSRTGLNVLRTVLRCKRISVGFHREARAIR